MLASDATICANILQAIYRRISSMSDYASVPMKKIGPIKLIGPEVEDELTVPLATYETPLWPSTNRGAKVSRQCGGILTTVVSENMTRSILLEGETVLICQQLLISLRHREEEMRKIVQKSSRFARLQDWHYQIVGNIVYLRFAFFTADASGHNMATQAADHLLAWIVKQHPEMKYLSISANYCTDKKASCVNGILGRGRYVVAETTIPRHIVAETLKTTPERINELNIKKNLIGTMLAGSVRSANAHFANVLLAFYLATGQDAANIIEGSQGFVHTELRNGDLYFSATLPNIIVGTIGNGKHHGFVRDNLALLKCTQPGEPGINARRLAAVCAATVLCGELSLLAAQTNPGELMRSHTAFERTVNQVGEEALAE